MKAVHPHIWLPEPLLSFHPDRESDRDVHPLRGLCQFGPHSGGLMPDPVRVATIAPESDASRLYQFMRELREPARPRERTKYLPEWPGFREVYGVHMKGADKGCHLRLGNALDAEFGDAEKPHLFLAEKIGRAIQTLESQRHDFDVLFLYLPQRWAAGFESAADDFDLHDHLKAITAARRLPLQIIREDKAIAYPCRASLMWRIGLALYAKAGGIPWTLADVDPETAFIGLSYAVRPATYSGSRFVTCCSQVFDAEGSGLEFIAYDAHDVEIVRDNPFLARAEMFRVLSRAMDLYRRRHAGKSPRRVMVHKTTEFKADEVAGAMEALHLCESIELTQVVSDVGWRGARINSGIGNGASDATPFPVPRGSLLGLSGREALLWTHGDAMGIVEKGSYFQGEKSTPRPIRLVRHAGHGPWDDVARGILGLTKMDWNNDALYDPLPVTLSYAQVLAQVVKRMTGLGSTPYQFRFFM